MPGLPGRARSAARARFRAALASALVLAALCVPAGAQEAPPRAGDVPLELQAVPREAADPSKALDVPYEGSEPAVLDAMFDMARVGPDDFVVDLGSGDGRIVIQAARRFGARGLGVDLNAELVAIANARARAAGLGGRVRFERRDIFKTDISPATVLTMFLYPNVVMKLRPKILSSLAPGTRVLSNEYHLGLWRPDAARAITSPGGRDGVVYMWVVPARVQGLWIWELGLNDPTEAAQRYRAKITQKFQDFGGEVVLDLQPMAIFAAALRGAEVKFSISGEIGDRIVRHDFTGRVNGDLITGTVRLGGGMRETTLPWRAWRAPDILR